MNNFVEIIRQNTINSIKKIKHDELDKVNKLVAKHQLLHQNPNLISNVKSIIIDESNKGKFSTEVNYYNLVKSERIEFKETFNTVCNDLCDKVSKELGIRCECPYVYFTYPGVMDYEYADDLEDQVRFDWVIY